MSKQTNPESQEKLSIADLLALTIEKMAPRLAAYTDAELAEIHATEAKAGNPREGVFKLLAALQTERAKGDGDTPPEKPADDKPKGKAKAKADAAPELDITDWRHPEYPGPLTGDQAAWRNRHIKPVGDKVEK